MSRKPRRVVEFKLMVFTCNGEEVILNRWDLVIHANETPCDVCGSHGSVWVWFTCPVCGQEHEIELESW